MLDKKLKFSLLVSAFLMLFGIIIIPAPLRGLVVIFFLISTFLNYQKSFKTTYFILNSLLYFGLILSLVYSKNKAYGSSFIFETQLALLILPLGFTILNDTVFKHLESYEKKALGIYTVSVFILSLIPFLWLLPPHHYSIAHWLHHYNGLLLSPDINGIKIHPVYLSINVGLSILILVYLMIQESDKKNQFLYSISLIYFLAIMFLLSKRGAFIGLFFGILSLFWFYRSKKTFLMISSGIFLMIILSINLPKMQKRLLNIQTAGSTTQTSASKHLRIYKPAWHLFKKAPFLGHGLGSHKTLLIQQYKKEGENDLYLEKLNTHNQLMSFLIIGGLFLGCVFIFYFLGLSYKAYQTKQYFLIVILIFFTISMLFENILERAQGVLIFTLFIAYFSRKTFSKDNLQNKHSIPKITLIGPLPPPVTGESQCNYFISKKWGEKMYNINTSTPYFDEKVGQFDWQKFYSYIKTYFLSYKILKADIVYATIGQTFLGVIKFIPFFILAKINRKPIVIHIHGNNLANQYHMQKGLKKIIFKKTIRLANTGIVLSESLKTNLLDFLASEQIKVLPNFVDPEFSDITKQDIYKKDFSKLKIIFLSNLMTQKGIFELLEALTIIEKEKIPYEAILAGEIDHRLKSSLLKIIENLKFTSYKGPLYGIDKKEALLSTNLFILPSYREGQPLSIFEAMAAGNLIITTPQPGITDLFSSHEIFYVSPKNVKALVDQIKDIHLNLNTHKSLSLQNHIVIKSNFTFEKFSLNLKHIFNEANQ